MPQTLQCWKHTQQFIFSQQQLDGSILIKLTAKAYIKTSFTYQSPKCPDEKAPLGLKQKNNLFSYALL